LEIKKISIQVEEAIKNNDFSKKYSFLKILEIPIETIKEIIVDRIIEVEVKI